NCLPKCEEVARRRSVSAMGRQRLALCRVSLEPHSRISRASRSRQGTGTRCLEGSPPSTCHGGMIIGSLPSRACQLKSGHPPAIHGKIRIIFAFESTTYKSGRPTGHGACAKVEA